MPVKNNIKKIRKERGIKQVRMAEELEVTRQTFTAIENNKYNPSLELALKIVKYFELPIEEVFILKEEEKYEK
ncbi:helix-turn-helix transcriptional regulator [Virgibacillus salexigens]|uniref:helix-turn-helix transcriptional regulator n=1 Tax=Virgibacillus salexigens TaxID=61016 RepID=UPI00190D236D|nr:helix-turn-helix transcriptional regulator [Virgibacillus salexigens]